jgi:hypothetical protein
LCFGDGLGDGVLVLLGLGEGVLVGTGVVLLGLGLLGLGLAVAGGLLVLLGLVLGEGWLLLGLALGVEVPVGVGLLVAGPGVELVLLGVVELLLLALGLGDALPRRWLASSEIPAVCRAAGCREVAEATTVATGRLPHEFFAGDAWAAVASRAAVPGWAAAARWAAAGGMAAVEAWAACAPTSSTLTSPPESTAAPASAPTVADPACRFLTVSASPQSMSQRGLRSLPSLITLCSPPKWAFPSVSIRHLSRRPRQGAKVKACLRAGAMRRCREATRIRVKC